MILFNQLKQADIVFFAVCIAIIVIIVAVWLLIPVFNKRQYKEQRDSLRKREAAFKGLSDTKTDEASDKIEEDIKLG
ncbi:MAG: hypothetical protein IJS58_06320 [Bacilli bacterium]|jgi:hypothetical protein|nr:hypothetical protein [Bacilli bacterium]